MASFLAGAPLLLLILLATNGYFASSTQVNDQFEPIWAVDHVIYDGDLLKLKLDHFSGAGLASKSKYVYGKATAEMKLISGDSAGTVTAFYMSSEGSSRNEFDFEFLGNRSGEPYLVQTNVYLNGEGNREQRMDLWFDPTSDFHNYSISWSPENVKFSVDETPIRVFENKAAKGVPYPDGSQPMGVFSSIWNADDWATQGGRLKTNWSNEPFVTTLKRLAVETKEDERMSVHESHELLWARARHLVYDYCWDSARFPTKPLECER